MARPKKNGASATVKFGNHAPVDLEDLQAALEAKRAAGHDAAKELAINTLSGDLRDFILNKLQWEQDKRPWRARSEAEQRETVQGVEAAVHEHVARAVELIAAAGQPAIFTTLDSITIKDGVKATISLSKHDANLIPLIGAQGGRIMIVVADPEQFSGERAPVKIKADQGDIEDALVVHSSDDDAQTMPGFEESARRLSSVLAVAREIPGVKGNGVTANQSPLS